MKQFITRFTFCILATSIFFMSGCSTDDEDPSPSNLEQFVGAYNVVETCSDTGEDAYQMTISISGSELVIDNFYDVGTVKATASGSRITIPEQAFGGFGYSVSGSGLLITTSAGDQLQIQFMVGSGDCSLVANKL